MKKIAADRNYRITKIAESAPLSENSILSNNRITMIRISLLSMGIKEILGFMGIVGAAFGLGKWGGWIKDKWDSLTGKEKEDAGDQEIVQNLIASLSAEELEALYHEILAHREIEELIDSESIAPKGLDSRLESAMREISDKFEKEIINNNQEEIFMLDGKKIAADRNYEIIKEALPMLLPGWLLASWVSTVIGTPAAAATIGLLNKSSVKKIINSITDNIKDEDPTKLYNKWYSKLLNTDLVIGLGEFPVGHDNGGAFMKEFVNRKWMSRSEMSEEEFEAAFEKYYGENAKGIVQFGLQNEEGWVDSFNLILSLQKGQDAAKAAGKDWRTEKPDQGKKIASNANYRMLKQGKKIASNANYRMLKRAKKRYTIADFNVGPNFTVSGKSWKTNSAIVLVSDNPGMLNEKNEKFYTEEKVSEDEKKMMKEMHGEDGIPTGRYHRKGNAQFLTQDGDRIRGWVAELSKDEKAALVFWSNSKTEGWVN